MEYLVVLFIIGALLYYLSDGIEERLNATSQQLEIYAKEVKIANQEKMKELSERIKKTINKNDGWYTIETIDEYIKKNVKKDL